MIYVILIALSGGLFAILTFIHFFVDWIFQSHAEAMVKHNNPKVRAKHCAIYTLGFVPLLIAFIHFGALTWKEFTISLLILFVSHFCEDTYLPVYFWAKHIRKPPQMFQLYERMKSDGSVAFELDPKRGFKLFVETSIGKILMIVIDQIIHLAFLFPIVWFVIKHVAFFLRG